MVTTAARREHLKRQMAIKSTDQMPVKMNLAPPTNIPDSPRPQKVTNDAEAGGNTSLKIPSIRQNLLQPQTVQKDNPALEMKKKGSIRKKK